MLVYSGGYDSGNQEAPPGLFRRLVAVFLDDPVLAVLTSKLVERKAKFVEGVKGSTPQERLLGGPVNRLGHAVAFGAQTKADSMSRKVSSRWKSREMNNATCSSSTVSVEAHAEPPLSVEGMPDGLGVLTNEEGAQSERVDLHQPCCRGRPRIVPKKSEVLVCGPNACLRPWWRGRRRGSGASRGCVAGR